MPPKQLFGILAAGSIGFLAWLFLFGVTHRTSHVHAPSRVQLFEHDRILAVHFSDSNDVFVVAPLTDQFLADSKVWFSPSSFQLRSIWVDADSIHDAYLDQREHHDILAFNLEGSPTPANKERFSGADAVGTVAQRVAGGDDLPYGSIRILSQSQFQAMTSAHSDADISTSGRLRFSTYWHWQACNKPIRTPW